MKKAIIAILVLILAALGGGTMANLGGSPGNLPSDLATTSTAELGTKSVEVVFATSSRGAFCSSRVITTYVDPILLQFSPGVNKSNYGSTSLQLGFGHLQAASTTVSYPAEDYGCGAWIGASVGVGSTTITISEYK